MGKYYKRLCVTALLAFVIFVPSADVLSQDRSQQDIIPGSASAGVLIATNYDAETDVEDVYNEARDLYAEKRYDDVIQLLSGPCYRDPMNIELNVLLAKAQTEKCAQLKEQGDKSYEMLVKKPYETAVRLHKMTGMKPELYYITARCLLINDRPTRAKRSISKALYFNPGDPEYLVTLGDIYCALAEKAKRDKGQGMDPDDLYSNAKDAYQQALAAKRDDDEFVKRIEEKLKNISK